MEFEGQEAVAATGEVEEEVLGEGQFSGPDFGQRSHVKR